VTPVLITLLTNIDYGTLVVNGLASSVTRSIIAFSLNHTTNTVRLEASPFKPLECHVSLPLPRMAPDGHRCSLMAVSGNTPTFNMEFSALDLPDSLQTSLTKDITGALAQADTHLHQTVPAGQHYAIGIDAHGIPEAAIATTDLDAELHLAWDTTECDQGACANSWSQEWNEAFDYSMHSWILDLNIHPEWRFASPDGAITTFQDGDIAVSATEAWRAGLRTCRDPPRGSPHGPSRHALGMDRGAFRLPCGQFVGVSVRGATGLPFFPCLFALAQELVLPPAAFLHLAVHRTFLHVAGVQAILTGFPHAPTWTHLCKNSVRVASCDSAAIPLP
jgi:hypothetical protein